MPHTEQPLPFHDALPDAARAWYWRLWLTVTLAFWPCQPVHTAFQVKVAPLQGVIAHNVALYGDNTEGVKGGDYAGIPSFSRDLSPARGRGVSSACRRHC